jgi:uncharacterized membrane protein YgcG
MRRGWLGRAAVAVAASAGVLVCAGVGDARQSTDTTPPTITGATDVTAVATSDCYQTFCATVTYPFTVSDPDDPASAITVACSNPNGQTYFWGMTMTTCQAHDPAGNYSPQVTFKVTVAVPPPTFTSTPGALSYPATGPAGGPATFATPTAVDVGGQSVPVTCDHQSGITYPIGTTTVTCTAQIVRYDQNGNPVGGLPSASSQFTITITAQASGGGGSGGGGSSGSGGSGGSGGAGGTARDTTPPVLEEHTSLKVDATGPGGASVHYAVVVTDPDDGTAHITITCSPGSGGTFPLGRRRATRTTTVTCHAEDAAGNQATAMTFAVTVRGVHDQLARLEAEVTASRALAGVARRALVAELRRADAACRAGSYTRAASTLASFVAGVGRLQSAPRTKWIHEAARIIAVVE